MDQDKVRAVREWPRPCTQKELQRRFIRDYSRVAAPLTALFSCLRSFVWTPEAEEAFRDLRGRFTSAPILTQPDPSRQFVVEVDASDVGVGAVLSQRSVDDGRGSSRSDTIIPRGWFIGAVLWKVEEEVKAALLTNPGPVVAAAIVSVAGAAAIVVAIVSVAGAAAIVSVAVAAAIVSVAVAAALVSGVVAAAIVSGVVAAAIVSGVVAAAIVSGVVAAAIVSVVVAAAIVSVVVAAAIVSVVVAAAIVSVVVAAAIVSVAVAAAIVASPWRRPS
ncbi:hypothetical protein DPEC_G00020800 [Dallia pectoralis]|uniref:Uncharacterized protein n=1 Tax=Dallia pectoralis TaxID=75939 RepID=A0ACC2HGN7_DALPE|nr:hypothetical protein DPEC_G00020800 [Dallia pectoralis]